MLKKGTMINVKKGLGVLLGLMAVGFAFNVELIKNAVMDYSIVSIGILAASSYLLIIAGRQIWIKKNKISYKESCKCEDLNRWIDEKPDEGEV